MDAEADAADDGDGRRMRRLAASNAIGSFSLEAASAAPHPAFAFAAASHSVADERRRLAGITAPLSANRSPSVRCRLRRRSVDPRSTPVRRSCTATLPKQSNVAEDATVDRKENCASLAAAAGAETPSATPSSPEAPFSLSSAAPPIHGASAGSRNNGGGGGCCRCRSRRRRHHHAIALLLLIVLLLLLLLLLLGKGALVAVATLFTVRHTIACVVRTTTSLALLLLLLLLLHQLLVLLVLVMLMLLLLLLLLQIVTVHDVLWVSVEELRLKNEPQM
uniref:Uncharacterized protein n=1 Tax=Anopheles atroparvus TaxID=41427 RepID=A0A182JJW2_ANOAO